MGLNQDPNQELTATQYEVRQGAAWITLDRVENRNALSAELVNELHAHLVNSLADASVRSIVITGNGVAFCAGADLKSPPGSSISGGGKAIPFADVLELMLSADKPILAAVNGAAFGGGIGLIAASDIVITDETAQFSFQRSPTGCNSSGDLGDRLTQIRTTSSQTSIP